jgi:hypothetical protein
MPTRPTVTIAAILVATLTPVWRRLLVPLLVILITADVTVDIPARFPAVTRSR